MRVRSWRGVAGLGRVMEIQNAARALRPWVTNAQAHLEAMKRSAESSSVWVRVNNPAGAVSSAAAPLIPHCHIVMTTHGALDNKAPAFMTMFKF